jgi:Fe-S-cluster containining protein
MWNDQVREAVMLASDRPEVCRAVVRIHAQLQEEIDRRRPICVLSGRCCQFEEYEHRLYVTTMELAAFVHDLRHGDAGAVKLDSARAWDGSGCPFQVGKLCGAHAIRPFGCRVFFCDATAMDWQEQQYAHFHALLRQLHETLQVPYYYLEWRSALRSVLVIEPTGAGHQRAGSAAGP